MQRLKLPLFRNKLHYFGGWRLYSVLELDRTEESGYRLNSGGLSQINYFAVNKFRLKFNKLHLLSRRNEHI